MKKAVFLIYFLTVSLVLYSTENVLSYSEIHKKYFPRDEGSLNEKRVLRFIENFCLENEFDYIKYKIDNEKNIVTNSYNIEVKLKGSGKQREQIIIICPLNTSIINQKHYDNSLTFEIIMDVMLFCKNLEFKKDIIFLFAGSIEDENKNYNGIKYFFQKSENLNKSFITVINILSNKSKIKFSGSINRKSIPSSILKKFYKVKKNNKKIYFSRNEIYKSRFNLLNEDDYVSFLLSENISAVSFSNKENTKENLFIFDKEYPEQIKTFFYNWMLTLDKMNFPIEKDYHYLFLDILGLKIYISETFQVIFLIFLVIIVLSIRIFFPNFQRFHFRLLFQILPYFIIIFLIYYLSSFIPFLLYLPLSLFLGIKYPYMISHIIYFISTFMIPLVFIYMLYQLLKKLPFPKHSFLYVFGALIFSFLNLIIFLFIDISIAHIYVWTIILITLSQFTGRNYTLKYFFYYLSPMPFVFLFIDLTFFENLQMLKNINPFFLNLSFTILTFPFILLFLRIIRQYTQRHPENLKKKFAIIVMSFIAVLSYLILIIISISKYPETRKVDAKLIADVQKNITYIEMYSENNIGEIFIEKPLSEKKYNIKDHTAKFSVNMVELPYSINYTKKTEDYANYNFTLTSQNQIEYLNIYLIAPIDFYPVESNYNFIKINEFDGEYDPKKQEVYKFLIGRNPDKTFNLNIKLIDGNYKMCYEIEYPMIPEKVIKVRKKIGTIIKNSKYIDILEIKYK